MPVHAGPYNGKQSSEASAVAYSHARFRVPCIYLRDPDHFSSQTISIGPSRLDHRSSSVTIKVRGSFNFNRSRSLGTGRSVTRNGSRHSRGHSGACLRISSTYHVASRPKLSKHCCAKRLLPSQTGQPRDAIDLQRIQ